MAEAVQTLKAQHPQWTEERIAGHLRLHRRTVTAILSDDELSAVFDVRRVVVVAEQVARRVAAAARASVGPGAKPR